MATKFEKPLKEFLNKFQKDLNQLQKSLKRERDDLLDRVKSAAQKDNIKAKRHEIEKLIEKNLKKYEPQINKFVHELNTSAKRAGVDLTELEKKVRDNLKSARTRLSRAGERVKSRAAKAGRRGQGAPGPKKASTRRAKPDGAAAGGNGAAHATGSDSP